MPNPIGENYSIGTGQLLKLGLGSLVPTAEFIGSPLSGSAPLTVTFTNQSTGSITSYLWDFGDGQTSTSANPSHAYTVAGTYTVALTATGPGGSNTRTRTSYVTATSVSSDIGTLIHDGPSTPEQISLWLPITNTPAVPQTATATCRYKPSASSTWTDGHPLYRVQPQWSDAPVTGGAVLDGFAWPVIDLSPGVSYDIEVTVNYDTTTIVRTLTHTTRSLPPSAGAPNKFATDITNLTSQLSTLVAGDVLEIAAGTYTLTAGVALSLVNRTGTSNSPIYIRGASRTGTILRMAPGNAGSLFYLLGARWIVFENMTLQGSGDHTLYSRAFNSHDEYLNNYITIRHVIATGFSSIVYAQSLDQVDGEIGMVGTLVYDNTFDGVCTWSRAPVDFLGSNASWGNDGINIGGSGSCAWNNTIKGFGDTFACATHAGGTHYTSARGVHIHHNEIRNSCDDTYEVDYGRRNLTFYDNRVTNCINAISFDPLHGGPFLMTRNIYINLWRKRPWKWNTFGSGFFIYNNTLVMGVNGETNDWGSYISGGAGSIYHRNYGYRNNVFVWQGGATNKIIFYHENVTHNPIDWDHNCHWPDAEVRFGSMPTNELSLAGVLANWPTSTPLFSTATKRFQNDAILASAQPFSTTITLGADANTEVTTLYTPAFSGGVAKNSGAAIANITDGYSGAAPDRGAVIAGRTPAVYGDRTGLIPAYIQDLVPYQVRKLTGSYAPTNGKETLVSVEPTEWTTFGKGVAACIAEYSGGAKSNDKLHVIGGGHSNGAFNGVLTFDPGSNGSSLPVGWGVYGLSAVADVPSIPPAAEEYLDGRASSRHTYDGVFKTTDGVIYTAPGGIYGPGGVSVGMWKIKPGVFDWTRITDYDANPNLVNPSSVIYDPVTNKALLCVSNPYFTNWKFLRCDDDTLSAAKTPSLDVDGEPMSAWDSTRGRALYIGQTKAMDIGRLRGRDGNHSYH